MAARHASELELLRFDDEFEGDIRLNEPMARHTTYRIGGPAHAYAQVNSIAALATVLKVCADEGLSWFVSGKGSNLLVSDEGYPGVVIALAGEFRAWQFDEEGTVVVGAGTMLSRLVQEAFHHGYSGMEFAVGTPGTVGGALVQNAGTAQDWIGSRVVSVTTFNAERGLRRYVASELSWGYRSSSFSSAVSERMNSLLSRRKESQPLEYPTCGSVFMNPEGESVGKLIEDAGLKGKRCGDAQVSEKHANFIVNRGSAAAQDVATLINEVRLEVRRRYGIELQTEVKFLGFPNDFFEE